MLWVVCLCVACVCATNEPVVARWRESRSEPWMTQPAEASPLFGLDTQLAIPRPLSGTDRREIEFSFGKFGNRVQTPFLLVYEPETLQLIKGFEFVVEYSGKKLLAIRHSATYEKLEEKPSRVFVSVTIRWREQGVDSWAGWTALNLWLLVWGVFMATLVSLDELLRNRVGRMFCLSFFFFFVCMFSFLSYQGVYGRNKCDEASFKLSSREASSSTKWIWRGISRIFPESIKE